MATTIKSSSLTPELRNYIDSSAQKKKEAETARKSTPLIEYMNKAKQNGTYLSLAEAQKSGNIETYGDLKNYIESTRAERNEKNGTDNAKDEQEAAAVAAWQNEVDRRKNLKTERFIESEKQEAAKRTKITNPSITRNTRTIPLPSAAERFTNIRAKELEDEKIGTLARYSLENSAEDKPKTASDRFALPSLESSGVQSEIQKQAVEKGVSERIAETNIENNRADAALAEKYGVSVEAIKKARETVNAEKTKEASKTVLPGITRPFTPEEQKEMEEKDGAVRAANTVSYTAGAFGMGAADMIKNTVSGLETTLGDAATGGAYSDGYRKIEEFFETHDASSFVDATLYSVDKNGKKMVTVGGKEALARSIAKETGVSQNIVSAYIDSIETDAILEKLGENVSDTYKNTVGQAAYTIGQQIPGILLTMGASNVNTADDAVSFLTKKITGNASTALIGASVAGSTINDLARKHGYDPANYMNAVLQGTVEAALEKAFGFSDAASFKKLITPTGNTKASIVKSMFNFLVNGTEEGVEELINVPASEIIDRLTGVSDETKLVGEGGIFDFKEMVQNGLSGAAIGLIMGSVAAIGGVTAAVQESKDIQSGFKDIDITVDHLPDEYKPKNRPTDASKMTMESFYDYEAEAIDGVERYMKDLANGTASTENADSAKADIYDKRLGALQTAISSASMTDSANVAKFVQAFAEDGVDADNAIKRANDFVKNEIDRENAVLLYSEDKSEREEAGTNKSNYVQLHTALRNNKAEIKSILESRAKTASEETAKDSATDTNVGDKNGAETVADVPETNVGNVSTEDVSNVSKSPTANTEDTQEASDTAKTVNDNGIAETQADANMRSEDSTVDSEAVQETIIPDSADTSDTTEHVSARTTYTTDSRTAPNNIKNAAAEILAEETTAEEAAETMVRYFGSVHEAVDHLNEIKKTNRNSGTAEAQTTLQRVREVERHIINENKSRVTKHTQEIAKYLREYGIENVVIDDPDSAKLYGTPKEDGYFDSKTDTIHITAHSSENKVLDGIIAHEFMHRAMKDDPELVNDILDVRDKLTEAGRYTMKYTPEEFRNTYADQTAGKSEQEAENIIREETASHFVQDIFESENLMQALARDNRSILRRILDFIVDMFDPKGKKHRAGQRAADKIRKMLDSTTIAKSANVQTKTTRSAQTNTDSGNTSDSGDSTDIRYSRVMDASDFTYQNLVSKPDMKITKLETPESFASDSKPSRADIVKAAIDNARGKNNPKNTVFNTYVRNKDTGTDILVGKNGIEHGLTRSYLKTALASAHIGDLIENAILINEHTSRENNGEGGIYLSAGIDGDELYLCRIITNDSNTMEEVEVMYALNAKKESAAHYRLGSGENLRSNTDSTISIADLLDLVKKYFADVLPADVLRTMEIERPASTVSDSVKYSRQIETAEEKRLRNAQDWNDYFRRQYTSKTAFGRAKAVKPSDRHKIAVEISHDIPGVSTSQVERLIKPYFNILERPKSGAQDTAQTRWAEAERELDAVVTELVDSSVKTQLNPLYETLGDLRKKLRETPIKSNVSPQEFGGESEYRTWRQGNTGLIRISSVSNALTIDTFYQELSEQYPEFFPADITNEADQLKQLGDIAVKLKQSAGSKYESVNPLEEVRQQVSEDLKARISLGFEQYAKTTEAAKQDVANAVNENDVRRAYTEGQSDERINTLMVENILKTTQQDGKKLQATIDMQNAKIKRLEESIAEKDINLKRDFEFRKYRAELERLNTMLTEPTRQNHVPDSLRKLTAKTLEFFGGEKTSRNKIIDSDFMKKIAESVIYSDTAKQYVSESFEKAVESGIKRADEYKTALASITKEDFEANPEETARKAAQLEYEYLHESNNVLEMLKNYIVNANRVFIAGRATEAGEFANLIKENMQHKHRFNREAGSNRIGNTAIKRVRGFARRMHYESASPVQFFALFGESGDMITDTLQKARDTQKAREEKFADYMLDITGGKYNTSDASGIGGKRITVQIDGNEVDVSRAQLMYIYAAWKDPSAKREMKNSGISLLDSDGNESSDRRFKITDKSYKALSEAIPQKDKEIADAIMKFLSGPCAEWGNEATQKMYGFSRFSKSEYMPVRTVDEAVTAQSDKNITLENASFTHRRNPNANSPVIVGDIFDIVNQHVKYMAAYSTHAPVVSDLKLIFQQTGVNEALRRGMGSEGLAYIQDFMDKLNNPNELTRDETATYSIFSWLGSTAQRAAVNSSISTATKQFLSLPRAFVEIPAKYVMQAYSDTGFTGRRQGRGTYGVAYRNMVEHSGVAKVKMLGFSDTGYGKSLRQIYDPSYIRTTGKIIRPILTSSKPTAAILKTYDNLNEFGTLFAEKADENVWTHLYRACELEAAELHPNTSDAEREEIATRRFNSLIGKTQVVDSLLDAAPMKEKLKNTGLGYFMSESLKSYAALAGAIEDVRDGRKGAGNKLAKISASIITTNLFLEPIINAVFRTFRDEEDDSEQFFRKVFYYLSGVDLTDGKKESEGVEVLSSEAVQGIFSIVPMIGEVYDIIADALQNYSNSRMETQNLEKLAQSAEDLLSNDSGSIETTFKKTMDFISAFCSVIGTGFNNVYRDVNAAYRAALSLTDNHLARWEYNKMLYNIEHGSALSQKNFYDILAHTLKEGDVEAYTAMREDLANIQKTSSIGVKPYTLAENLKDRGVEEITPDSPFWYIELQARFALGDLNTANRYAENLITEVYTQLPDDKKSNVLYSSPDKTALESSVKKSLTYAEYENFVRTAGTEAYQLLIELKSRNNKSSTWSKLNVEQKRYAIERIYDYTKSTNKKKINKNYELDDWMQKLYEAKPTRTAILNTILDRAENYTAKED